QAASITVVPRGAFDWPDVAIAVVKEIAGAPFAESVDDRTKAFGKSACVAGGCSVGQVVIVVFDDRVVFEMLDTGDVIASLADAGHQGGQPIFVFRAGPEMLRHLVIPERLHERRLANHVGSAHHEPVLDRPSLTP